MKSKERLYDGLSLHEFFKCNELITRISWQLIHNGQFERTYKEFFADYSGAKITHDDCVMLGINLKRAWENIIDTMQLEIDNELF